MHLQGREGKKKRYVSVKPLVPHCLLLPRLYYWGNHGEHFLKRMVMGSGRWGQKRSPCHCMDHFPAQPRADRAAAHRSCPDTMMATRSHTASASSMWCVVRIAPASLAFRAARIIFLRGAKKRKEQHQSLPRNTGHFFYTSVPPKPSPLKQVQIHYIWHLQTNEHVVIPQNNDKKLFLTWVSFKIPHISLLKFATR